MRSVDGQLINLAMKTPKITVELFMDDKQNDTSQQRFRE
jgi:hypothetical protein